MLGPGLYWRKGTQFNAKNGACTEVMTR